MAPDFTHESQLEGLVAGVDEVGRGPWAGPVVATACILWPEGTDPHILQAINDSKKLTKQKREDLFDALSCQQEGRLLHGIGQASVAEIDQMNILQATFLAMKRAIESLPLKPDHALIDGNKVPPLDIPCKALIKGDSVSLSIAAASIIAKVYRDRLMEDLSETYPHYGWQTNAGYGTKAHQDGLAEWGVTPHHRRSFAPIKKVLDRVA